MLSFGPSPITKWPESTITEDHVFDAIEFLHDHVSKPGNWVELEFSLYGYDSFDEEAGRAEFRDKTNRSATTEQALS